MGKGVERARIEHCRAKRAFCRHCIAQHTCACSGVSQADEQPRVEARTPVSEEGKDRRCGGENANVVARARASVHEHASVAKTRALSRQNAVAPQASRRRAHRGEPSRGRSESATRRRTYPKSASPWRKFSSEVLTAARMHATLPTGKAGPLPLDK
eukprot:6207470-Pleurochrysis_carterae.AAC.6